jgi:hypothetical protein
MENTKSIPKLRNLLWWKKMLFPLYFVCIYSISSDISFTEAWVFGVIIFFIVLMYRFGKYHFWLQRILDKEELTLPDKQECKWEYLFGWYLVVIALFTSIGVLYEKLFQELPRGGIYFDDEFILFFITASFAIIFSILLIKETIYSLELSEAWTIQKPDETVESQE